MICLSELITNTATSSNRAQKGFTNCSENLRILVNFLALKAYLIDFKIICSNNTQSQK